MYGCVLLGGYNSAMQWLVEDDDYSEQFVVGGGTQFLEGRQLRRAISSTAGEVDHRVNSQKVRQPSENAPRTGGIGKAGDDFGTVHVM